jgi:hypothetical protein
MKPLATLELPAIRIQRHSWIERRFSGSINAESSRLIGPVLGVHHYSDLCEVISGKGPLR